MRFGGSLAFPALALVAISAAGALLLGLYGTSGNSEDWGSLSKLPPVFAAASSAPGSVGLVGGALDDGLDVTVAGSSALIVTERALTSTELREALAARGCPTPVLWRWSASPARYVPLNVGVPASLDAGSGVIARCE